MSSGNGTTAAKFDANIRALRGTVMGPPIFNTSTEGDYFVGLVSGLNGIASGVLSEDVVEPGYPLSSDMWLEPTTGNPITGSLPPPPFVSGGQMAVAKAWGLHRGGNQEVEVIAADTTITQDCDLVAADAYGRVTNISNLPPGTVANVVGRAKYPATAVNQRIRMIINLCQVTVA